MAFAWTPDGPHSAHIPRVSIFRPPLLAAYGAVPARASSDCSDATLTILPRPRATIPRATARPTRNALVRLVSSTRRHASSGKSSSGDRCCTPALFTRMSSGPSRVSTSVTPASTASASVTSKATGCTRAPAAAAVPARPPTVSSSVPRSRPCTATEHPASTRPRASARPIPRLDPVTSAVRPAMSNTPGAIRRWVRCSNSGRRRGLDDPDVVAVGVRDREHQRRAAHLHRRGGDRDAVDGGQALVLGVEGGGLDPDRAAARLVTHRRVQRETRRRAGRGDFEPAHLAVLAEAVVPSHLPPELVGVEGAGGVLVGHGEHGDADVGDGGGAVHGGGHGPTDCTRDANSSMGSVSARLDDPPEPRLGPNGVARRLAAPPDQGRESGDHLGVQPGGGLGAQD